MPKHTVELLSDTVTQIVLQDLSEALDSLVIAQKHRSGTGFAIFDSDPALDRIEIQRHIDALHLVISYYGKY